jgi:hypothetical protein
MPEGGVIAHTHIFRDQKYTKDTEGFYSPADVVHVVRIHSNRVPRKAHTPLTNYGLSRLGMVSRKGASCCIYRQICR